MTHVEDGAKYIVSFQQNQSGWRNLDNRPGTFVEKKHKFKVRIDVSQIVRG